MVNFFSNSIRSKANSIRTVLLTAVNHGKQGYFLPFTVNRRFFLLHTIYSH